MKQIHADSTNGIILQLEYKKAGYTAHTVLKKSIYNNSDNVMYEALVGFFLNEKSLTFPSFLETYGLYDFSGGVDFNKLIEYNLSLSKINKKLKEQDYILNKLNVATNTIEINNKAFAKKLITAYNINQNDLISKIDIELLEILRLMKNNTIKPQLTTLTNINETTIKNACKYPTSYAVLIQHLKNVKTMRDMNKNPTFVKNELIYALFQVYMTLASISKIFTHYDLHDKNVLMYEPVANSYIEYHYHINKEEVVFKSSYIAKIIDYGKCYFKRKNYYSEGVPIWESFINFDECKSTKSLSSFSTKSMEYVKMNSAIKNESSDLKLIQFIKDQLKFYPKMKPEWMTRMPKIIFGEGLFEHPNPEYDEYFEYHGTEEKEKSGLPESINNVTDAYMFLKDEVKKPPQISSNDSNYSGMNKLGELHIYDNGDPMRYEPAPNPTNVGSESKKQNTTVL